MRDVQTPFDGMDRFFEQMRQEMFGGRPTPALGTTGYDGWDAGVSIEETGVLSGPAAASQL